MMTTLFNTIQQRHTTTPYQHAEAAFFQSAVSKHFYVSKHLYKKRRHNSLYHKIATTNEHVMASAKALSLTLQDAFCSCFVLLTK